MYLNTITQAYPVQEQDIRAAFPNISFPHPFVPPEEYVTVFASPLPTYDKVTQFVRETAPLLTDKGHYEQHWEVVDLDAETIAANQEAARIAAIPSSVSPRQIRQALTRAGLRTSVETAVASGNQDLKDWWEFATEFQRTNQHVVDMATALGVTERQLDDLFTLAGSL